MSGDCTSRQRHLFDATTNQRYRLALMPTHCKTSASIGEALLGKRGLDLVEDAETN